MASSPTASRLALHQDWVNDLPLKFLWTVDFQTRSGKSMTELGNSVNRVLTKYERVNSSVWQVDANSITSKSDSTGNFGYLLAQAISFPSEGFRIKTVDTGDTGGYITGYAGSERNNYGTGNKLDITFLETNIDVIDYFIKPWIIASSHRGLIEDGNTEEDIKCNIIVNLHTKDKSSYSTTVKLTQRKFEPRKQITFYNAVPYQVAGDMVSYGLLSYEELTKVVSFAFSHYSVTTPSSYLDNVEGLPLYIPSPINLARPSIA